MSRQLAIRIVLGIALGSFLTASHSFAQDSESAGRDALKSLGKLPWYNAERDDLRRVETDSSLSSREAASQDRNSIDSKPEVKKKESDPSSANSAGRVTAAAPSTAMQSIAWLALVFFLAIIAALLIWAFLRADTKKTQEEGEEGDEYRSDVERIEQLPFDIKTPAGDWLSAARAAYQSADYRRAVMYLFSHMLLSLDRKGFVKLARGKTNLQYLGELNTAPELSRFFRQVMVPFEQSFFGNHDIGKEQLQPCMDQLSEFERQLHSTTVVN